MAQSSLPGIGAHPPESILPPLSVLCLNTNTAFSVGGELGLFLMQLFGHFGIGCGFNRNFFQQLAEIVEIALGFDAFGLRVSVGLGFLSIKVACLPSLGLVISRFIN